MPKSESPHLATAQQLLETARTRALSFEEKEDAAIQLATCLLQETLACMPKKERVFTKMARDPAGVALVTALLDQGFRSPLPRRCVDQILYLLHMLKVPSFLPLKQQLLLHLFKGASAKAPSLFLPLLATSLRRMLSPLILSNTPAALNAHIKQRLQQGFSCTISRLGAPTPGRKRELTYLDQVVSDLHHPLITSVSIKLSSLISLPPLFSWEDQLETAAHALRRLYQAALASSPAKLVMLDMEEYATFRFAVRLFIKVLSEHEFASLPAGITIQAYLPDSHALIEELTSFAKRRTQKGGAPLHFRLVKGTHRSYELVTAAQNDWPSPLYRTKGETDSSYKKLLLKVCQPMQEGACYVRIASHHLFDLAFALLTQKEAHLDARLSFEGLEGIAPPLLSSLSPFAAVSLYCPVVGDGGLFQTPGYFMRRLEELSHPDHFFAQLSLFSPRSKAWQKQSALFSEALDRIDDLSPEPKRTQNREEPPLHRDIKSLFENEPPTDFSLPHNRAWAEHVIAEGQKKSFDPIPLVIAGEVDQSFDQTAAGVDPSRPDRPLYTYALARWEKVDAALTGAKVAEPEWQALPMSRRCELIMQVAAELRRCRKHLTEVLLADVAKPLFEADRELSEAIDFAEYYLRCAQQFATMRDLEWQPRGTLLIASPWNFPLAIPTGGLCSALLTGNCVLFKPAQEAVLAGWELCQCFWEAGVPKVPSNSSTATSQQSVNA